MLTTTYSRQRNKGPQARPTKSKSRVSLLAQPRLQKARESPRHKLTLRRDRRRFAQRPRHETETRLAQPTRSE